MPLFCLDSNAGNNLGGTQNAKQVAQQTQARVHAHTRIRTDRKYAIADMYKNLYTQTRTHTHRHSHSHTPVSAHGVAALLEQTLSQLDNQLAACGGNQACEFALNATRAGNQAALDAVMGGSEKYICAPS